jgi:hypothetical protein
VSLAVASLACSILPLSFVSPCDEARFAAVAAIWRYMQEKAGDGAPGDGRAKCLVEHQPELGEVGNTFGGRRFGDAAAGIPVGEVAYCLGKTAQNIRIQLEVGRPRGPFGSEEVGGVGNECNDAVWRGDKKFSKEIVFVSEVCHRRDSTDTIVGTHTSEAGREPSPH